MPRKTRAEFPRVIYHVINRGNYRSWIFESEGARDAFEKCLFETYEKSAWILHAYMLMSNHYHLALEMPDGNPCTGMHWLQGTFANPFNRLRKERGHLFQGRYKSLFVEKGEALGQVCNYIHLNPVRAFIEQEPELVNAMRERIQANSQLSVYVRNVPQKPEWHKIGSVGIPTVRENNIIKLR